MYAVIATGGKQYRVAEGQILKVELIPAEKGKTIEFDKVLMVGDGETFQIGAPYLPGMKVSAEVIGQGRAKKIRILKFRRRKHHMKQMGHRQDYIEVKIMGIGGGTGKSKKAKKEAQMAE